MDVFELDALLKAFDYDTLRRLRFKLKEMEELLPEEKKKIETYVVQGHTVQSQAEIVIGYRNRTGLDLLTAKRKCDAYLDEFCMVQHPKI